MKDAICTKLDPDILSNSSGSTSVMSAPEAHRMKPNKSALVALSDYLMDGYHKEDEQNQHIKSFIWYNQAWRDEFLQWNPAEFDNLTRIKIPTQLIWLPDIMIEEVVGSSESLDVPYVSVNQNGLVHYSNPIRIVTYCNLDIYYFPFDVLNCSISFHSWMHTIQEINISFARIPHDIKKLKNPVLTEGEWDLLNVVPKFHEYTTPQESKIGLISFNIIFRRKPLFYNMNLILPSILLMIMDLIGFYIPPDSGERISFKITLLLGYSVLLITVEDMLPPVGAPLIGIYFSLCMLLLLISLSESILIVGILHKKTLCPDVPKWLKKAVLEKMAGLLLIKDRLGESYRSNSEISSKAESSKIEKLSNYNSEKPYERNVPDQLWMHTKYLEAMNSILEKFDSIWKQLNKPYDENSKDWLCVAYVIDTFLFRAYCALLIAYTLTMVCLWSF
ncbi:5-hydroxytryptamine receptor 3A-like [Hyperolius riggenbachi]|uniref:5-hydroxytryptamine receptor 3A-like n=1 Tax=Hyperolius riggenbachi TaxID=752182 RepID=UPI0035A37C91